MRGVKGGGGGKGTGREREREYFPPTPLCFFRPSNLRVAFSTLSNLPLSQNRKRRLQRNEHKQTAFQLRMHCRLEWTWKGTSQKKTNKQKERQKLLERTTTAITIDSRIEQTHNGLCFMFYYIFFSFTWPMTMIIIIIIIIIIPKSQKYNYFSKSDHDHSQCFDFPE